jgi:DNA-binding transcriptional LysR family regulator
MNLYHLKYFHDAALTGQISGAAHKNLVTQSAISQGIRSLEETLECKLLVHQRNRFQLTEEGKIVFKSCAQIFGAVENMKNELQKGKTGFSGELAIGSTLSLGSTYLPPYLSYVKKHYPEISLKVRLGDHETVKEWLAHGEIELGIVVGDDKRSSSQFDAKVVGVGKYLVVQSPAFRGKIDDEGIVVNRADRKEVKYLINRYKARHGSDLKISMEIISWEVIKNYVLSGHGFGVCPDYVVRDDLAAGSLKKLSLGIPPYSYQLVTLVRKGCVSSKNATMFLELLKSADQSLRRPSANES